MGKKGSWFSAVRKALGSGNKKKDKKKHKSEKWSRKQQSNELDTSSSETALVSPAPPPPPVEQMKLMEAENEQNKHSYSVAIATAIAAEAAVAPAQAAAEVVRLTAAASTDKSKEEIASRRIQTAFRRYLARRALKALRGLVRLKTMIQEQSVKRQATSTLRCMQTLARVQSQVRARRIRISEENQALQRQLQQRHETEQEKLKAPSSGDEWDDSTRSKEQVDSDLQMKQDAAMRRERALAYAYTHQPTRKNPSKSTNQTFMNPNNPHWGWSWLERWMAARPWEDKCAMDKELNSDNVTAVAAITHCDFHLDNRPSPTSHKKRRPPSHQSTSIPRSKTRGIRPPSPKVSYVDDDSRSMTSAQSERCRRHSFAGSSIREDESLASSLAVPGYMAATESARARSRLPSPMSFEKSGTSEKGTISSAKKRLSFSSSPGGGQRRQSDPPKVEM
ncbi:unnamed protein product [Withania somnifera]